MRFGRVLIIGGALLGAFIAFWLLSQRRVPSVRVSQTLGRRGETSDEWLVLE